MQSKAKKLKQLFTMTMYIHVYTVVSRKVVLQKCKSVHDDVERYYF